MQTLPPQSSAMLATTVTLSAVGGVRRHNSQRVPLAVTATAAGSARRRAGSELARGGFCVVFRRARRRLRYARMRYRLRYRTDKRSGSCQELRITARAKIEMMMTSDPSREQDRRLAGATA
eukprot:6172046-Pleurochrysis_carterae.AAC.3